MNPEELHKVHNEIKQSYRLLMNGVTAQSLRDKGLDYHLNWGANLLHLQEMAQEYPKDYDLACALWNDDIRESKILATMLMPVEAFPADQALQWIEQTHSQEIAEIASKYLYSKTSYAKDLALQLISQSSSLVQLHGYCILSSLLYDKVELSELEINEFIDQAKSVLNGNDSISLKHSVTNALTRLCDNYDNFRL